MEEKKKLETGLIAVGANSSLRVGNSIKMGPGSSGNEGLYFK
jgi:hypothetical protein